MSLVSKKSIAIIGRQKNGLVLDHDKSIQVTTDIENKDEPTSINLDYIESKLEQYANDILLASTSDAGKSKKPESIVYGESLVELLKWMIKILKTHKHPPNAPPIPTFFKEADNRSSTMEEDILNKHVKSR